MRTRIIGFAAGFLIALVGLLPAQAKDDAFGFFRFPDVRKNKVVFTSEGDLWQVPLRGGIAIRLTVSEGEERFAKFSPDGQWIAFTGQYDGNSDVYLIPSWGGEACRLTYHPDRDQVVNWTPDNRILFRSQRDSPLWDWRLYTIGIDGGYPQVLPLTKASRASFERGGNLIAFNQYALEFHRWKRYKGGWAQDIWVGNIGKLDFKKITKYKGNDNFPMWYGNKIYFLSDSTGRGNLWSMNPDGSSLRQLTFHRDYDVRFPSLGEGKICYQYAMDIWVYDISTSQTHKIDIRLPSDRLQARRRYADPKKYITGYDLSPDGKRLLVNSRGELFSLPTAKGGLIRRLSWSSGARIYGGEFSPDGQKVVGLSDSTGEMEIWLWDAEGGKPPRRVTYDGQVWRFPPRFSPDGKRLAFSDKNLVLYILDPAKVASTVVDTGSWEIRQWSWSPDSRWLAYTRPNERGSSDIFIYDTKSGRKHLVTDGFFRAFSPTWDPDGKYLFFLSDRTFNPYLDRYDSRFINLGYTKPYLLVLQKGVRSPFAVRPEGQAEETSPEKDKEGKDKKEEVKVEIDWDGLAKRIAEFPLSPGNYKSLRAIKGKVYWLSWENKGMLGEGLFEEPKSPYTLHLYDQEKRKDKVVAEHIDGYDISDDLKKVVTREGSTFRLMEAGQAQMAKDEDEENIVPLEDWTLEIDPQAEWRQMFAEAWRLQRDFFYDPNMHGVDWKMVYKQYGRFVSRISSREELNDLIGEMFSELSAGHTYVWGGDWRRAKRVGVGLLGIDVEPDPSSGYYRITRVLRGNEWDSQVASPLLASGVDVEPGLYLLKIDGRRVNSSQNYLRLLQNKAGIPVALTVNSKPTLEDAREVVVKALKNENRLRYEDWVQERREYTLRRSGGKLGYIHLPDMGSRGLSIFSRDYYPQHSKEGLVIDVRENGGGFVAEMILSYLSRKLWAVGGSRNSPVIYRTPEACFWGYMAALCDGETGSDGETFTEGFKRLKLGPVIGMRTWGGWIGIRGNKPLRDKGFLSEPEFPGWSLDGKWLIEGWGTVPDIEVENDPSSTAKGLDPQLDYAINYLLQKIATKPKLIPPHPPYPDKSLK